MLEQGNSRSHLVRRNINVLHQAFQVPVARDLLQRLQVTAFVVERRDKRAPGAVGANPPGVNTRPEQRRSKHFIRRTEGYRPAGSLLTGKQVGIQFWPVGFEDLL